MIDMKRQYIVVKVIILYSIKFIYNEEILVLINGLDKELTTMLQWCNEYGKLTQFYGI